MTKEIPAIETQSLRKPTGQALVEGVVALVLIIGGTVLAVVFLVNAGMSTYYKQKLGFVTTQAATYAASLSAKDDLTAKTTETTKELLSKMGLPSSNTTVTAEATTIGGKSAVSVSVQTNDLPLFGKGNVLPLKISLRDQAVAMKGSGATGGKLYLSGAYSGSTLAVPIVEEVVVQLGVPSGIDYVGSLPSLKATKLSTEPGTSMGIFTAPNPTEAWNYVPK